MTNRPKAIGTAAETLVVRWLRANGYPVADRRTMTGSKDRGDILATPGLILEVKAGQQTRAPGDALLDAWCHQADAEALNDPGVPGRFPSQTTCLLVLQRHGTRDAARWWVVERGVSQGYTWRELGEALAWLPAALQPQEVDDLVAGPVATP